jgi:hypothetical protein
MKPTDDDHDTHEDYLGRQEDEMSPTERWADACEGAIRAVEMASFEEQGATAIEQAWELLWLAKRLAGTENQPEQFTTRQVDVLRSVGVRVEPRTNEDSSPNQAIYNDRADEAEEQVAQLQTRPLSESRKRWIEHAERSDAEIERLTSALNAHAAALTSIEKAARERGWNEEANTLPWLWLVDCLEDAESALAAIDHEVSLAGYVVEAGSPLAEGVKAIRELVDDVQCPSCGLRMERTNFPRSCPDCEADLTATKNVVFEEGG